MTKKFLGLVLAVLLLNYLSGCRQKEQIAGEAIEEQASMETLATLPAEAKPTSTEALTPAQPAVLPPQTMEVSLPPVPAKPKPQEIQIALSHANYYAGAIDGKIGPMTRKAIEEFQKANGLEVDGKVGPKTWRVLSKYLETPAAAPLKKKR
jgi:peptidoglycan hydrolase-like protein with peptidoglycan-binding domain